MIYFLECASRIKIGYTRDLKGRVKALSTGSPHAISVLGSIEGCPDLERAIHRLLKSHRAKGEWFEDHPEVRDVVQKLISDGPQSLGIKIKPTEKRFQPDIKLPERPKLKDVYVRLNACVDRYLGDHVATGREREQALRLPTGSLVNKTMGGHYSGERAGYAALMIEDTLDHLDKRREVFLRAALSGDPLDPDDFVPQDMALVARLEVGLQRLFADPTLSVIDLSGYPQPAAA